MSLNLLIDVIIFISEPQPKWATETDFESLLLSNVKEYDQIF